MMVGVGSIITQVFFTEILDLFSVLRILVFAAVISGTCIKVRLVECVRESNIHSIHRYY